MTRSTPSLVTAALVSLALAASAGPGLAKDKKKDTAIAIAAAAALALGVAALAHDPSDRPSNENFNTSKNQAQFEAGYRDGLYGARYRGDMPRSTYGAGYDAGRRERKLQQGGKGGQKFANVPNKAMKGCVNKAADQWDVKRDRVYATDARKGAAGTWLIEVVAGKRQGVCNMAANGTANGKFLNGASL
jgi:hypothetical protein